DHGGDQHQNGGVAPEKTEKHGKLLSLGRLWVVYHEIMDSIRTLRDEYDVSENFPKIASDVLTLLLLCDILLLKRRCSHGTIEYQYPHG
ncbi:MAG: hypothetical protein IJ363_01380, partial [Clostridia bacterium]|nr:hypothetical protein [Clostridia bacterium]